eukprot:2376394-Rhodomonas_salina.1
MTTRLDNVRRGQLPVSDSALAKSTRDDTHGNSSCCSCRNMQRLGRLSIGNWLGNCLDSLACHVLAGFVDFESLNSRQVLLRDTKKQQHVSQAGVRVRVTRVRSEGAGNTCPG